MAIMSRAEAMAFLAAGTRTGKLATASRAGSPHVVPVWFVVDDDHIVFTTGENSVKGRHLFANGRAALAVDDSEFPYSYVAVRGPVSLDENAPDMLAWAIRIAERYVPAGQARQFGERNAVTGEMLCRLHIETITGERDIAL